MSSKYAAKPFWPRVSPNFLACRRAVVEWAQEAKPQESIAVGLSGGADSLALTAALVAEGFEVQALCVDHGLQPGSAEQAGKAAGQAESLGARAEVLKVEVADRGSLEAAARLARYQAFAGATRLPVAVAHTADDQAETLLLGALRGKVAGMLPAAEIEGVRVVRPLLQVRRAQTLAACEELGLAVWHDPQNRDTSFRRVALRREIIPQLSQLIGGDAVPALAQAAGDAALDDAALSNAALSKAALSNAAPGSEGLDAAELAALSEPVRRRILAAWLHEQGAEVTREVLRGVGKLCTNWHGQGGVAVAPSLKEQKIMGQRLEVRRVGGKLALLPGH
ncbi:tRNA(Ile)-lysidine synthetase [Corynebacterium sp. HMSC06D04]|uniref:tRNA lysidine(34) synthetase TilS n=1 Tax=Corynebacterium TaxID=1716 RepID=UPI0007848F17|nr:MULTISPECIES: tRNA lysidine(34) synthetase TilS [Corynebacterium]OFR40107.1 tRNA(Ile)-lysidine synthetase [Corynebacterium sp. HMSC077D03]OFT46442.1 tRNA(Ile)-lysidine synthetase [Corynebacterium sp. HMSC06G04]OFT53526.1 tRNA(Ile)-lysidine synthetase [Corynebacterium sp. HMSC06D04]OHO66578.1 tRNA(Ile)-lysidine synthetase [Corynebacterium sp. HMSC036D03]